MQKCFLQFFTVACMALSELKFCSSVVIKILFLLHLTFILGSLVLIVMLDHYLFFSSSSFSYLCPPAIKIDLLFIKTIFILTSPLLVTFP